MSHTDITVLFEEFKNLKVAIIGAVMLDTYWWGSTDRISPEAPVPIVALQKLEYRVGGAANVALNAASLGANTSIISVIGEDADGRNLSALLSDHGITHPGLRHVKGGIYWIGQGHNHPETFGVCTY